jgi:predicted nucleotidyltransferase
MNERIAFTENLDPGIAQGNIVADASEISRHNFEALQKVDDDLRMSRPDYVGMSAYGSTVRGEAGPDSDVDLYVFVAPDLKAPEQDNFRMSTSEHLQKEADGNHRGSVLFHGAIDGDYKYMLGEMLKSEGVNVPSMDVLPINNSIVEDTTAELLANARAYDGGDTRQEVVVVPLNIRGLFHVPIEDSQLATYRKQVIDILKADEHGETAWKMIRQYTVFYEKGRQQEHFDSLPYRQAPADNLQDYTDPTKPEWV